MVSVTVTQTKKPVETTSQSTSSSSRVPAQKYFDIKKRIEQQKTEERIREEARVSSRKIGVTVEHTPSDEVITKVVLPYGAGSHIGWEAGTPVTEIKDDQEVTTTPYTLTGYITRPRKTEGIPPTPEEEKGLISPAWFHKRASGLGRRISQDTADVLGLSRQQDVVFSAPPEVKREPGVGISGVQAELLQVPGFFYTGHSLQNIAKAIRKFPVLSKLYMGTGTVAGGVMLGLAAHDIQKTSQYSQLTRFKLISMTTRIGAMIAGGGIGYAKSKWDAMLLKHGDYSGFVRKPNIPAVISDKTPPRVKPIPDPSTGKLIDLGAGKPPSLKPTVGTVEPGLTGYKGWTQLKETVKAPYVDIGKGGDVIHPLTETGYKNAMKYIVSDYGKPSKFQGFDRSGNIRLESGLLKSTEAYASLIPQGKTLTSVASHASPGKTLYWQSELIKQLNRPFTGVIPLIRPVDLQAASELLLQEQQVFLDSLSRQSHIQRIKDITITRQTIIPLSIQTPREIQRQQQGLIQQQQQVIKQVTRHTPVKSITTVPALPGFPRLKEEDEHEIGSSRVMKRLLTGYRFRRWRTPQLQQLLNGGL